MKKLSLLILNACLLFSLSSLSYSLPAPKYLSVPDWQACVKTVTKGSAQYICLPAKKPFKCPEDSWKALTKGKMVKRCRW